MSHQITTIEELEELYAQPLATTVGKESPVINEPYRRLIEAAPFCAIASIGPGGLDCSPRGDGPGFVRILDAQTVAIPDRRGNNRLDTLRNIVHDPRVALLFLIPGLHEALRMNGRATISTEPQLLSSFAVDDKAPATAIVLKMETMYFQCARALKRSRLWNVDAQVDPQALPSAGTLLKSVLTDFDDQAYDDGLAERQSRTLY